MVGLHIDPSGAFATVRTPDAIVAQAHASSAFDAIAALRLSRVLGVVAAVPDSWLDPGPDGAQAREDLRGVVVDGLGLPVPTIVPRSLAVAATVPDGSVVGEVSAAGVTAGVRGGGSEARLVAVERRTTKADPALRAMADALRALSPVLRERAVIALERATRVARYRDAPAYPIDGSWDAAPSVGAVVDAFAPVAAALDDALRSLTAARPAAGTPVTVCGDLAEMPPVRAGIAQATRGTVAVAEPADISAAAAGIAAGLTPVTDPGEFLVDLPVHRLHHGRLVAGNLRLPAVEPGDVVEVPPRDARPVSVTLRRRPTDPGDTVEYAAPPAGGYLVDLWPVRSGPGVLVLRPVAGGRAHLIPLSPTGGQP